MNKHKKILLLMFLFGIFIGSLDSGIVSPARTVIASSLSVADNLSVWMITIYTLVYAMSMPISGKLSDRFGKKKLFTISILIFGVGSLLAGLSNGFGSYTMLLIARMIQAAGGGGIMPIATAYIGASFPRERRGAALGLVGAVYGISNVLGPTVGSFLLDVAGAAHWGVLFLINVPIVVIVLLISWRVHEDEVLAAPKKMDLLGGAVASLLIVSLMYGLTNLNFHHFAESVSALNVWPFLLAFVVLLPVFVSIERRAVDPIINLRYFTDREIALTLALGFVSGVGMMGIVFVPQFAENVLMLRAGAGGYLVTLMAIFTGFAAPFGGRLVDKLSAKLVLIVGFLLTAIGALILAVLVTKNASLPLLLFGLALMGLGMGFTMGTPLNYLIQMNVPDDETASAQSTLSLVRSIGVAISPNILINFISGAGQNLQKNLMAVMPKIPTAGGSTAPMTGKGVSASALARLQNSDATTIVSHLKKFSSGMIDQMAPMIKQSLAGKLPPNMSADAAIEGMKTGYLKQVDQAAHTLQQTFQQTMNEGFAKLFITSAIIAGVGLLLALMLKNKKELETL